MTISLITAAQFKKLPKAARDELERLRLRAALSWPAEPEPEPLFVANGDHTAPFANRTVYTVIGFGVGEPRIAEHYLNGSGYVLVGSTSSRPGGFYYDTRRDAAIAVKWAICRLAARRLDALDTEILAEGGAS